MRGDVKLEGGSGQGKGSKGGTGGQDAQMAGWVCGFPPSVSLCELALNQGRTLRVTFQVRTWSPALNCLSTGQHSCRRRAGPSIKAICRPGRPPRARVHSLQDPATLCPHSLHTNCLQGCRGDRAHREPADVAAAGRAHGPHGPLQVRTRCGRTGKCGWADGWEIMAACYLVGEARRWACVLDPGLQIRVADPGGS